MSALKNVIAKNKKTKPAVKASKFYKPPERQTTEDIVLPDNIKIELSQDFDAHRASGNVKERIHDFDRMHPVKGLSKGPKHFCTWFWVPLFGWIEAPVRMAWHLVLGILFILLSLITICQIRALRRMAYNNFRLSWWYLGVRLSFRSSLFVSLRSPSFQFQGLGPSARSTCPA